jgi:hypothetical protein
MLHESSFIPYSREEFQTWEMGRRNTEVPALRKEIARATNHSLRLTEELTLKIHMGKTHEQTEEATQTPKDNRYSRTNTSRPTSYLHLSI